MLLPYLHYGNNVIHCQETSISDSIEVCELSSSHDISNLVFNYTSSKYDTIISVFSYTILGFSYVNFLEDMLACLIVFKELILIWYGFEFFLVYFLNI